MPRLPHSVDFNDLDYPELTDILRGIDIGIAAIIASDPAMRPKPARQRRPRGAKSGMTASRKAAAQRRAA